MPLRIATMMPQQHPSILLRLTVVLLLISLFSCSNADDRADVTSTDATGDHVELSPFLPLRVLLQQPKSSIRGTTISTTNRALARDDDWEDDDWSNNKNDKNGGPPDDVYHCDDPETVWEMFRKDKTVECDWDSHEWDLDALDESFIPKHCDDWEWEFEGEVDDLKDWEEPCYLWSITYGDLAPQPSSSPSHITVAPSSEPSTYPSTDPSTDPTIYPSATPSTATPSQTPTALAKFWTVSPTETKAPTVAPTSDATDSATAEAQISTEAPTEAPSTNTPTDKPTDSITYEPTFTNTSTVEPTTEVTSPEENNVQSPIVTVVEQETEPPAVQIYKVSTMVLTFLMTPSSRRRLASHAHHVVDRQTLEQVTTKHVRHELKRALVFWLEQQELDTIDKEPLQVGVELTLTQVRAFLLPNETMVATEAMSGIVRVQGPATVEWPETIEPEVEAAFQGTALTRYVEQLHLSDDFVLQGTDSIEVGLPLDLLGGVPNGGGDPAALQGEEADDTVWTVGGVDLSLTTLAIIAASIAVFSIFLLLCVCWKLQKIRKQHFLDEQQSLPTTKPSHSTEDSSVHEKKSRRSLRSGKTLKTKNKSKKGDSEDLSSPTGSSELIDESDPNNNRYYQRYVAENDDRSLATSTYSYLDSNLQREGGGGVSLAPSFLYGNDDASLQSKTMWSLIDGITNQDDPDASYNYHQTASPADKRRSAADGDNKDHLASTEHLPATPDSCINLITSPSNMMITTATKPSYDDSSANNDDNFSLTSLGVGMSYQDKITLAKSAAGTPVAAAPVDANVEEQAPPPAATPTSHENTPHNPFAEENEARMSGRLGVSARKKKGSGTASVRKALGQLAACATSKTEDQEELLPAPSDEQRSEDYETPATKSYLEGVHERYSQVADSTVNSSKNSSLHPDKLFDENPSETTQNTSVNSSNVDILKGDDGNYAIDTMSSF